MLFISPISGHNAVADRSKHVNECDKCCKSSLFPKPEQCFINTSPYIGSTIFSLCWTFSILETCGVVVVSFRVWCFVKLTFLFVLLNIRPECSGSLFSPESKSILFSQQTSLKYNRETEQEVLCTIFNCMHYVCLKGQGLLTFWPHLKGREFLCLEHT